MDDNNNADIEEEGEDSVDEDEKMIIQNGRELIKESNRMLQEIKDIEAGQELYDHGKSMIDTLLKKQEAKELMEKGMVMVSQVKESKETQAIIKECTDIITFIQGEDKVKDIIDQCKSFIGQIKSKDGKDIEREQIETLIQQGSSIFTEFKENQQSSIHLERMKKMIIDLKEAESTRIAIMNGISEAKKWVDSLKEKDPQYKNVIDQGEELINQLKNDQDVNEIVNDGKKILDDILSSPTPSNGEPNADKPTSPEMIMNLIGKSSKVAENVKTTLKKNKLVEEYSQRQDVKEFLEKGEKFIHEVKSKEQLIGFLKQNKDFIKEIKNTIVPFITDQLLKVQIPVVKGNTKGFNYEISNLVFAGLVIPPEGVNVDFGENNEISVSVSGFQAQLKNFIWSYKQDGFPYLKDSGNASALANKNNFTSITFEIDQKKEEEKQNSSSDDSSDSDDSDKDEEELEKVEIEEIVKTSKRDKDSPEIKITEIKFKIDQLEVIVEKGKALWLYNYLISKFSDSIRDVVETKIKGTITTHVTTLSEKINNLVDQYWSKLISTLKSATGNNDSPKPLTATATLTSNQEN